MLIPDQPITRKHSYISLYDAVLALTTLRLQRTLGFMPRGGARGQNLGQFFFLIIFI